MGHSHSPSKPQLVVQQRARADTHQDPHPPYLERAPQLHASDIEAVVDSLPVQKEQSTPSPAGSQRQTQAKSRLYHIWLHWFTAYRILIGLTFVINVLVLIFLVTLKLPLGGALNAAAANLFTSVLVRQEELINASFDLVARTPSRWPLGTRRVIADFHHYGGVHIGCAVAALLWYIVVTTICTIPFVGISKSGPALGWHWANVVTCYAFLLFILLICLAAIPRLRAHFHNFFERTHRFGGWASLLVLWTNTGVSTRLTPDGEKLYKNAAFWLLAATTILIILPWLRNYTVPVHAQAVSNREIKLTFPYAQMPHMSISRFSLSPLIEWHAFATIPSRDGFNASILVSAAGDWTTRVIANPPNYIWIRRPPVANFLAFSPIFNSVLLVATGAGIGPMLSLLSSPTIAKMKAEGKRVHVLWCVYDPDAPHWRFVQDIIRSVDPVPKIFDSCQGQPDLAFEARYLAQVHDIEAVMVVSNQKVTNAVVREVKACGGAAYGAVFDS
jgi:hypothetical protein